VWEIIKFKEGGSKYIYKRDITESGRKGYSLADFPREGGVFLDNQK
jgi:hypothetical protein